MRVKSFIFINLNIFFIFFFTILIFADIKKTPSDKKEIKKTESSQYLETEIKNIENPQPIKSQGILSSIINFLLSLLFVIGLIYVMMIALKYFYLKTSIPLTRQDAVKILAREYLDSKKSLYIVEFGEKILLLGVTENNISKITEITAPEEINKIKENVNEFLVKMKLKNEKKFSEQLKANYINQTRNIIDKGNEIIKKIKDKFLKGGPK